MSISNLPSPLPSVPPPVHMFLHKELGHSTCLPRHVSRYPSIVHFTSHYITSIAINAASNQSSQPFPPVLVASPRVLTV